MLYFIGYGRKLEITNIFDWNGNETDKPARTYTLLAKLPACLNQVQVRWVKELFSVKTGIIRNIVTGKSYTWVINGLVGCL